MKYFKNNIYEKDYQVVSIRLFHLQYLNVLMQKD
jgi:hypothetical protein